MSASCVPGVHGRQLATFYSTYLFLRKVTRGTKYCKEKEKVERMKKVVRYTSYRNNAPTMTVLSVSSSWDCSIEGIVPVMMGYSYKLASSFCFSPDLRYTICSEDDGLRGDEMGVNDVCERSDGMG